MSPNPFARSTSRPGTGSIKVSRLDPAASILEDVSYQYPLKLIAPAALTVPLSQSQHAPATEHTVHTVFLLTYGGGLVAGDTVDLNVRLAAQTRLSLLTQGSSKIFKTADAACTTHQRTRVTLEDGAALCYLPDPVQPFADSSFEQRQEYVLVGDAADANLCVLDWVSEGRTARGEKWAFHRYESRNEVWLEPRGGRKRLLLRDAIMLHAGNAGEPTVSQKVDGVGVFGTLILGGPMFRTVGDFFMSEFTHLPRIGAKQFDAPDSDKELSPHEGWRAARVEEERRNGVLWTVSRSRGFVVVKFSADHVEGGKGWLRNMLRAEGPVEQEFCERALLCLR